MTTSSVPTTGHGPSRPASTTPIEPIMAQLRDRARERLGWGGESNRDAYERVKAVFQATHEALAPGAPYYPQVLGGEEEWEVPTPLAWETHRGKIGGVLVWFKRKILFPLNRWLYSYVWHNLHRQQRLNLRLLSAVESLAVSHARLRHELEELRLQAPKEPPLVSLVAAENPNAATEAPGPKFRGPMRLAFVVDRYGPNIPGGSERHCREFAQRLAQRGHAVTVLTSCAQDYVSWANFYAPGPEQDGPVNVVRFPVAAERDPAFWHAHSRRVFSGLGSEDDERRWFQESGPYVPALVDHLREDKDGQDLFVFFSYRYYPTFAGLPEVAPRSILVPTAEEDPAIRLGVLREFFTRPHGVVHNTIEEHELMSSVTRGAFPAFEVIGCGVDEAATRIEDSVLEELGVRRPYVLCLGRVDPNKGSTALLEHFRRYVALEGGNVQLVMAGEAVVKVPWQPNVLVLGHVSEKQRSALLQNMHALVAPSPFESLSMALLEAWMHGRPAIVNGVCKALKGQVRRANGGLYYDNAGEFREALRYLLEQPETATQLGAQGRAYTQREYAWPVVMERLETFLQERLSAVKAP